MPIFEYSCEHCSYAFDRLVINRDAEVHCPLCHGKVKKLMSTFAISNNTSRSASLGMERKMCTTCG
jgi:putative FmdB family regulatory protein